MKTQLAIKSLAGFGLAATASAQSVFTSFTEESGASYEPDRVSAADMDGDGDTDLVISRVHPGATFIVSNDGVGHFSTPVLVPGVEDGTVGDVDGDGFPDLVWFEQSGGGRLAVSPNLGDGTFGPAVSFQLGDSATEFRFTRLEDLDGDGALDLVFTGFGFPLDWPMRRSLNLGNGTFGPIEQAATDSLHDRQFEFSDIDGDGIKDIVSCPGLEINWHPGLGGGLFGDAITLETVRVQSARFQLGDMDGDGLQDIVFTEENLMAGNSTMRWIRSVLGGAHAPAVDLIPGPLPRPLFVEALRDFDLDGDLDLVLRSSFELHYMEHLGSLTFADAVAIPSATVPFAHPNVFDADGDGDTDLVTLGIDLQQPAFLKLQIARNGQRGEVGVSYCGPGAPNSTGRTGKLTAYGTVEANADHVVLVASDLPAGSFGYFIVSPTQDLVPSVPGSEGTLCLGGAIGRYVGPGQIGQANADGQFRLRLALSSIPIPNGPPVAVLPGESWNFQAWHRDSVLQVATSNFTAALELTFQ